jgi:NAD(P)-dependent dehydrogenase (short-subunit alcohol dehydrogenase family)
LRVRFGDAGEQDVDDPVEVRPPQAGRGRGAGRVRSRGGQADVTFETGLTAETHTAIDAAYRAKYDRYGPGARRRCHRPRRPFRHPPPRQERYVSDVVLVIGAGSIGQAIARRISAGKHVVLADLRQENADAAAVTMRNAGFDVTTATVDVSSRQSVRSLLETARQHGDITRLVHAAGVSPSQAPIEAILAVDLYGTAMLLEEVGDVIASGGAGVVIASQSGHRLGALTPEQNKALATTPADELLALPFLQLDQVTDTLHAYQLAKRGNVLRVMAEAVRWAKRGARVNAISPGIVITPLAVDELTGPRGEGYRGMLEQSPTGRAGTPDEIATVTVVLGPDGAWITGSDFLMDGGVTASYFYGDLAAT